MGMNNPPASTVVRQLFKTPGGFGVVVVLYRGRLHIYGSVVDGARGDSSERRELEYVTEAVEGVDCQGPMTVKWGWGQSCDREGEEGGALLSASPWLWMLDEPLQCDICRWRRNSQQIFNTQANTICEGLGSTLKLMRATMDFLVCSLY